MPTELGQVIDLLPALMKAEDSPCSPRREPPSPETARQLFRQFRYQVASGPQETLQQLQRLCFQWLRPEAHSKEQILELLLLEQFLSILPAEVQTWVRSQAPGSGQEAAALVESLRGDPQQLWQWIHTQVLGQDLSSKKVDAADCPMEPCLEVLPQEPGLQKSPSGLGEPPRCIVKEERDSEQGLAMAAAQLPARPEERLTGDQPFGASLLQTAAQGQWKQLDCTQKEQHWDLLLETYGKMVLGGEGTGIAESKPDLAQPAECGQELAGLRLHVRERGPRPTCTGDRQENDKENLNLENHRDQAPPGAPCHASEEAASQAPPGGLCREDAPRRFREETLHGAQETLWGPGPGGQPSPEERDAGKQLGHPLPDPHPGDGPEGAGEGSPKGQPRALMARKLPSCRECGRSFSGNSQLVFHQRTHSAKTCFPCPVCPKAFPRSSDWARHQRVHTGERPCKCDHCGKGFCDVAGLRHHKKTHASEKPFKCALCDKSFIQRSNFNSHQRVHTGERPYTCSHCGKSFSWRSSLDKHQISHVGKKRPLQ